VLIGALATRSSPRGSRRIESPIRAPEQADTTSRWIEWVARGRVAAPPERLSNVAMVLRRMGDNGGLYDSDVFAGAFIGNVQLVGDPNGRLATVCVRRIGKCVLYHL
jgi:hypothetical protein